MDCAGKLHCEGFVNIRIIGTGNMGSGLATVLAKHHSVSLYDKHADKARLVAQETGAAFCETPFEKLSKDSIVLLAIKPQDFDSFVKESKGALTGKILVSVLTGVSLETLAASFSIPVMRIMPNLAVKYGKGIIACASKDELYKEELHGLFSLLGLVKWIPEESFDAMTSLIGSGPGFMCAIVEAMVDAGIAMGLPASDSYILVKQMIEGTLCLLQEDLPSAVKWQITSPGGTTIAGLRVFEEKGVRSGIIETFVAAKEKSGQNRN